MHDVTSEHWHEPEGRKNAGYGAWKRPNTPYDDFMEAQGIPCFRGIGVRRVQDLPLKRWNRMGGNGFARAIVNHINNAGIERNNRVQLVPNQGNGVVHVQR